MNYFLYSPTQNPTTTEETEVAVATNSISINHNKGYFPLVQAYELVGGAYEKIDAQIIHDDNNNVTLNFNTLFTGKVVIF